MLEKLIALFESEIDEFIKENSDDADYDKDEVLDITTGTTGCEGCNSNSIWGFVRGMENAVSILKSRRDRP